MDKRTCSVIAVRKRHSDVSFLMHKNRRNSHICYNKKQSIKAAIDILRDENTGYLKVVKEMEMQE